MSTHCPHRYAVLPDGSPLTSSKCAGRQDKVFYTSPSVRCVVPSRYVPCCSAADASGAPLRAVVLEHDPQHAFADFYHTLPFPAPIMFHATLIFHNTMLLHLLDRLLCCQGVRVVCLQVFLYCVYGCADLATAQSLPKGMPVSSSTLSRTSGSMKARPCARPSHCR